MSEIDVDAIARGLTKAQRKAVLSAAYRAANGVWHPEGRYLSAEKRVRWRLCRLDLIRDYLRRAYPLTPLGLAVRQRLQEMEQ